MTDAGAVKGPVKESGPVAGLLRDFFLYGIMAGLSQFAGFILLPFLTRALSPEEYGTIEIVLSMTLLLSTGAALSLPSGLQRYYHEPRRRELVTLVLLAILCAGALLLVAGAVAAGGVSAVLLGDEAGRGLVVLGFCGALLHALAGVPRTVLRMERRAVAYNVLGLVYSAAYVSLGLYGILVLQGGPAAVLLAAVAAGGLRLAVALFLVRHEFAVPTSVAPLVRTLRYSLPMFPASLVSWVNAQVDRWVLLTLAGLTAVGVFGVAAKLALAVSLLTAVFSQSWSPHALAMLRAPSEVRDRFYSTVLRVYAAAFASFGLLITAVSPELLSVLAPSDYRGGYAVVPWLIGATVLHTSGDITTMGVVLSERTQANAVASWAGAVLNCALAVVLISSIGLPGAAVGRFVAELAFTGLLWMYSMRFSDVRIGRCVPVAILALYVGSAGAMLAAIEYLPGIPSLLTRVGVFAMASAAILCMIARGVDVRGALAQATELVRRSVAPRAVS